MHMPPEGTKNRVFRAKLNVLGCGLGSVLLALAALELAGYAHFVLALRMFVNGVSTTAAMPPSPRITQAHVATLLASSCCTSLCVFTWRRLQTHRGVQLAVLVSGAAITSAALFVYADAAARLRDPIGEPVGWSQLWLGVVLLSAPTFAALAAARTAARSGQQPSRWLIPLLLCAPLLVAGFGVARQALALLTLEQQGRTVMRIGDLRRQAAPLSAGLRALRPYVVLALAPLWMCVARSRGRFGADGKGRYPGAACAMLGGLALLCMQPFVRDARSPPPPALADYRSDLAPAAWREAPGPTECDARSWAPSFDPARGVLEGRRVTPQELQQDLETTKRNGAMLNPGLPFPGLLSITGEIPAARRVADDVNYLRAALAAGYQSIELEAYYWETHESLTLGSLRAWRRACGPRYLLVPGPVDPRLRWREAQQRPTQIAIGVGESPFQR